MFKVENYYKPGCFYCDLETGFCTRYNGYGQFSGYFTFIGDGKTVSTVMTPQEIIDRYGRLPMTLINPNNLMGEYLRGFFVPYELSPGKITFRISEKYREITHQLAMKYFYKGFDR